VTWDVTGWVRTAARVNDLKLIIRNLDPLGKKVTVDQARLEVLYGPTRPKSLTGFPVTLFVTDGWAEKDGNTLAVGGEVSTLNGSDNVRHEIESGYSASYEFQNIPANSVIMSSKVYLEHHEEEGETPGTVREQVTVGSLLSSPPALATKTLTSLFGELAEATVAWNVSTTINTAPKVNDLLLRVRNQDPAGKKAFIDRAYAVVVHREP
jgi:hypothetical protein